MPTTRRSWIAGPDDFGGKLRVASLSGYTARVLAAGDWWQAAKEDAADSYAALFTGEPLDADRRNWLCEQVDGLAEVAACPDNDMVTLASIR